MDNNLKNLETTARTDLHQGDLEAELMWHAQDGGLVLCNRARVDILLT